MQPPTDSDYVPALRFHWLTPYYDRVVRATTRERTVKQALIEQIDLAQAGQKVLDLACGSGTLAVWMAQQHPHTTITGVDGDPRIVEIAHLKAHQAKVAIQFDVARSDHLPYASDYFDKVASSLFFHHLSWVNKQRTAQEAFRVLKPGAELHIADWGRPANRLMRGLFVFIQLLDGFSNTRDNVAGRLIELLESAGFIEVSQTQAFPTVFGTLAVYRARKPLGVSQVGLESGPDFTPKPR
jgi:2-polyprenyl-3-methyl-5-hydroxy-6-metoxy-1,4-benzoquinol methylase